MSHNAQLSAVISAVRPALNSVPTTEAERAQFVYDLVLGVYEHVKFDVHHPTEDTDERARLGAVLDAALPECGATIVEVFGTLPDDPEKWADSDYSEEHYTCVLEVGHDGAHGKGF